jgi:hypothetical protein
LRIQRPYGTLCPSFRREGNKKTASPFGTYVYTCASILNGLAENKNDAHRAERGITMENEKKELNSSEMDQVNGGSFVSKNSKIIKRTAKKTSENQTKEERERQFVTAAGEVGTGLIVKKVVNWISDLFSGND